LRGWIAGQLALAPALSIFNAPLLNSYRRYRRDSFAPTRLVVGGDNRTCAFRVIGQTPDSIRVENRIPGADTNPYLAFAGLIAAGLHGLDAGTDIAGDFAGNAYESPDAAELPGSLIEAAVAFASSEPLRAAFGSETVDHYANAAVQEYRAHERRVSDVDFDRYFEGA
jgi:glutamine synthetase